MLKQYGEFSSIYDLLMRDVDYGAWATYVDSLIDKKGASILDCGCGTGELTIRLAKMGHKVVGMDVSTAMLNVAADKARKAGVSIQFVQSDMRNLCTHNQVDCIISSCDVVNYLTSKRDVESFFASAFGAIKPDGMLLFDVSSRHKLSVTLGNELFAYADDENAYIWQNSFDNNSKLLRMDLTFFRQSNCAKAEEQTLFKKFCECHIQRAHSTSELISLLSAAGFTDISVYEAFSFSLPKNDSERIQFVAHRSH